VWPHDQCSIRERAEAIWGYAASDAGSGCTVEVQTLFPARESDRYPCANSAKVRRTVADRGGVRHRHGMTKPDPFEQSAQIVEAFAESETDERVLELLNRIAEAIRDHAIDN
jgi:hypothetical protein